MKKKTLNSVGYSKIFYGIVIWTLLVLGGGYLSELSPWSAILPVLILFLLVFITLGKNIRLRGGSVKAIIICAMYIFGLYLSHMRFAPNFNIYANVGIQIVAVILLSNLIKNRNSFINLYIQVLLIMCIYSCICYFLNLIFNFTASTPALSTLYKMWMGQNIRSFSRNSGPFWEPGIYQIYINIALYFALFFFKNKDGKTPWIHIIVFCITILTTISTTGYLVMAGQLSWKLIGIVKKIRSRKTRAILTFLIPVLLLIFGVVIISTPAVSNKFESNNGSFIRRNADLIEVIPIVIESGPLGKGAESQARMTLMAKRGIGGSGAGNSIAYSSVASTYGWLTLLLFIGQIYRMCKKNFKEQWILLLGILLISWATEPLMMISLYYFFFVGFKDESTTLNKMGANSIV